MNLEKTIKTIIISDKNREFKSAGRRIRFRDS